MKLTRYFSALFFLSSYLSIFGMEPVVLDDDKIARSLTIKLGKIVDGGGIPSSKELKAQLDKKTCQVQLPNVTQKKPDNVYASSLKGTVALGSVYKCDKCDDWHRGGGGTAWVLTSDGIMVSNYHIFAGKDVSAYGIRTHSGKVAPVVEILAASNHHDIAIFRVKGDGFDPLPLGEPAGVGDAIHVIAHPDSRYYTYTAGYVSRYFKQRQRGVRKGAPIMSVTAEFARGSSGGPVLNDSGELVGMVASTRSLYTASTNNEKDPKGSFQMVIRNCVPVSAIKELIKNSQE